MGPYFKFVYMGVEIWETMWDRIEVLLGTWGALWELGENLM
jgi:hypothetical protein